MADEHAGNPAQAGNHEPFEHHLPDQPAGARAERRADREFPLTGSGSYQQQVGHVEAGNQEHQASNHERQRPDHRDRAGHRLVRQRARERLRHHTRGEATVGLRILAAEALQNGVDFNPGRTHGDTGPQPAEQLQRPRFPVVIEPALHVRVDDPEVLDRYVAIEFEREKRASEACRDDAGDEGGISVDTHVAADHAGVATKLLQPEGMAKDNCRGRSGPPSEQRPEVRPDAHCRKVVVADRREEELRRLATR